MKVGIRPSVNMLAVLRHLEYKPWYALAEYVDNSVQSFLTNRHRLSPQMRLRVSIEIDRDAKSIVISDNAAGIAETDLPRAFRAAEPSNITGGLGQFGMGMKSASCWFSPTWEVKTKAIGESVQRRIRFDINRIIEDRIEELEFEESKFEPGAHFTVITLRNVYQIPLGRTLGKIRDHLTDIYSCFLREGSMEIVVAGSPLECRDTESLQAPRFNTENEPYGEMISWRKAIAFQLDDGRIVSGQAGLLARGDTRRAGLCLFRRQRAIVGTGDEKYRPGEIFGGGNSYESQRVWGELHMDSFDVSHTKDGFQWGDSEEEFLDKLRSALDDEPIPLLRQARCYRSGRPNRSDSEVAVAAAVDGVVAALSESGKDIANCVANNSEAPPPPTSLARTNEAPIENRTFEVAANGVQWCVTVELSAVEGANEWLEIACSQDEAHRTRAVALRVFLTSPFMRRIVRIDQLDSLEPVLRLAAAVGLAEVLARQSGRQCGPGEVRRNVNELLASALSIKRERPHVSR
jgi:hypothetical protein